jgi:hypothetical protein
VKKFGVKNFCHGVVFALELALNDCKGCFGAGGLGHKNLCSYLNFDSAVVSFEISTALGLTLDYCRRTSPLEKPEYFSCTAITLVTSGLVKGSVSGKQLRLTPFRFSGAAFVGFQINKATVKGTDLVCSLGLH